MSSYFNLLGVKHIVVTHVSEKRNVFGGLGRLTTVFTDEHPTGSGSSRLGDACVFEASLSVGQQ